MKAKTLSAFVTLAASSFVIGNVLLGNPDPPAVWHYAFVVASFGFTISLHFLLVQFSSYWPEIWPYVCPAAAAIGVALGTTSFVISCFHIFVPGWSIFSNEIYNNLLMVAGVVVVFASILLYCRDWPRADGG